MACCSIQTWTISSLITAFLELALAFLLLWLASITFIIAKFVSIFGLHLPCSCNAFSQDRNSGVNGRCIQRALVEQPSRKISAISHSVLSKFPFELNCTCQGSSSCPSLHEKPGNEQPGNATFNRMLAGKQTLDDDNCCYHSAGPKGDHFLNRRANLKIRDKETEITPANDQCSCGAGEESKDSKGNPLDSCGEGGSRLLTGLLEENSSDKELPGAFNLYVKAMGNEDAAPDDWDPRERTSTLIELDGPPNSGNGIDNKGGSLEVLDCPGDGDGENTSPENDTEGFRNLKEALTVEREARNALYVELEKERSSAATAADEAMAMILRLQKEKASIEMEARQYKRMTEEKTVYDEVAIDILKQILMKRETEKAALENEVELHRRRLLSDRIDKWERESYTEVEGHMNESNSFSHGGRNRHYDKQETVPEVKNLLSVDTRPAIENEFDKSKDRLDENAKNAPNVGENKVLKSFEPVEDVDVLNANDGSQLSTAHGHRILPVNQPSKGEDYLGIDRMELMRPVRATVDQCSSPQEDELEADLSEAMLRLDGQLGLLQSMEANGVAKHDFVGVANFCQNKCLAREDLEQKKRSLQRGKTFKGASCWRDDRIEESENTKIWGLCSCNGKGFGNSGVDGMQIVNDEADHRLENDLSIHDVHVVLDDIQLSRKNNLKDKTASAINLSSDGHEGSGLLYGIEEKAGLPFAVENASLMEDNSADISSSHENENPTSGEQKVTTAGLILNTQDLPEESLKRSPSNDLRTKSMIIRDNARMKVQEEVQCLIERLQLLEAGRENLILSVESMKKEQIQLLLLEEIAQQLREIQSSKEGVKSIPEKSLPSSREEAQGDIVQLHGTQVLALLNKFTTHFQRSGNVEVDYWECINKFQFPPMSTNISTSMLAARGVQNESLPEVADLSVVSSQPILDWPRAERERTGSALSGWDF